MNAINVVTPEAVQAAEEARKALEAAKSYPAIKSAEDFDRAAAELRSIKEQKNRLESMRKALKAPVLETGRRIDEFFAEPIGFCDAGERAIKKQIGAYTDEQERVRREAERKAAEAAQRERDRLQAEAAKQQEAARIAREKAEAEALRLEEQGKAERAAAVRDRADEKASAKESEAESLFMAAATMPTNPVVAMPAPKAKGISTSEIWSAQVTDKMALIKAIAAGQAPEDLVDINMPLANKLAKALKGGLCYPGLKAVRATSVAARA